MEDDVRVQLPKHSLERTLSQGHSTPHPPGFRGEEHDYKKKQPSCHRPLSLLTCGHKSGKRSQAEGSSGKSGEMLRPGGHLWF